MTIDVRLREVEDHAPYTAALEAAGLESMLGGQWSCEDCEGCDTAWMLRIVACQTGEQPVALNEAISLLRTGHAPRGATPYPWTAERLLEIRRHANGGE